MRQIFSVFRHSHVLGRTLAPVTAATFAPLAQAQACLAQWLEEEGRSLSARQQQRASALIARYFEHEDDVSDALILSFLRHYGGMGIIDLEDPQAVRLELKAVLDRSIAAFPTVAARTSRLRLITAACTGMLAMAILLVVIYLSQQTLTVQQQQSLRAAVAVEAKAQGVAPATIWADIKREVGVTRYQDIRRWDYARVLGPLKK